MDSVAQLIKAKPMGRWMKCLVCHHEWRTRLEGRDPDMCARCHSAYWNVPKPLRPPKHKPPLDP
jgi:hypothetical protein